MNKLDLTFLTEPEIFGDGKLEIFKKYGTYAAVTDFSILLGAYVSGNHTSEGNDLKDRTGWYWTKTDKKLGNVRVVDYDGNSYFSLCTIRTLGSRPALTFSSNQSPMNAVRSSHGLDEIQFGEYPQTAVSKNVSEMLEKYYVSGFLTGTGKTFTTDSRKYDDYSISLAQVKLKEYSLGGKRYVRVQVNSHTNGDEVTLSNGENYKNGEYVWVEVEPIVWLKEPNKNLYVAKKCLYAGVQFDKERRIYFGDFYETEANRFLQDCFAKDILQGKNLNEYKEKKETINNFVFKDADNNVVKKVKIKVRVKGKRDETGK